MRTLLEILLSVLLVYGFYHEDKFIEFEENVMNKIYFLIIGGGEDG